MIPRPLARVPSLTAALIAAALLCAAPAGAASFTDPLGDNMGLNEFGQTVTAPDMTFASHQLLPDGRIELMMSFGPGVCHTNAGADPDVAPRANFALYTDSTYQNSPDFRIINDATAGSYVIRDNTSTTANIAQIEGIDSGASITVHFDPQYIGKPQQLRWMGSQTCKGRLPYEDVEMVPNTGFYALDLPFPPKPDPSYDPPTQPSPDPIPDALPPTSTAASGRMTVGANAAVKRLTTGIPNAGIRLSFSGLPSGTVTLILGTKTIFARGEDDTQAGKVLVRLKPTKAGRKALHGKGTLKTRLKLVFTPSGGGRQTTILRQVALKRRR